MSELPLEAVADASLPVSPAPTPASGEAVSLRELSPHQWRSGIAAWLGWLFDGLDMHLYTLVAAAFVAQLLGHADKKHPDVQLYSSWIQAAFLVGWALGGGLFGIIGDRLGRTRTLVLTILAYASFTGLAFFAQTWWQLMIFRFVAALGIGGEWAVGASLLSETWPRRWRPWMAAVLQTGVNIGILLASGAVLVMMKLGAPERSVFLIGVIPALLVLWIRKAVPETGEWHAARSETEVAPRFVDLFRGPVRRISILVMLVCACSLTAHWAYMFWCLLHLQNLPEFQGKGTEMASQGMLVLMFSSIVGNFMAAFMARKLGYRWSIVILCPAYFLSLLWIYSVPRTFHEMCVFLILPGLAQGVFALFTMYLPPLFPTLLRTSGAGFCYNIGRIVAAFGTVFFGVINKVGDFSSAIIWAGTMFLPAAVFACMLPEPSDERKAEWSPESVEPEV